MSPNPTHGMLHVEPDIDFKARWALELTRANALERDVETLTRQRNEEIARRITAVSLLNDGVQQLDLMTLKAEVETLTEGIRAALKKLGQPECSECSGAGCFYDDNGYSRDCAECGSVGLDWLR